MNPVARIDEWSRVRPERLAHVSGASSLTYGELKARSDALAAYLASTLGSDRSPVAVLGHKEPEMLIGFLGCIKAGRAYVPLDSSLPVQRIDAIVSGSSAALTLTPESIREAGLPVGRPVPVYRMRSSDPFYIMFTSGSTGLPKGVPITLECLEDFIDWMTAEHAFREAEIFLNQVPYSFDVSVMDTYVGLVSGGTVFSITREHIANPMQLHQALAKSGASTWVSTPTFAQLCLSERRFNETMLPHLTRFLFCGETLPPSIVEQLLDRFPRAEVWNTYGPTEATVATTSVRVTRDMLARYPSLPIGFPKPRTRIAVLNPDGRLVADGQRGEIVIAGPNVSPGYLNRPDATAKAFFALDGLRAYRTGDTGHYEDGMLFFDGRMDNQVKLNGYRIELGDVETHLAAVPGVREAVVLPVMKDGRVESLQAFVVLANRPEGSDFEISNGLRASLAERLPVHMLPRRFRFLDVFPMTVNGKADRRKLAELI